MGLITSVLVAIGAATIGYTIHKHEGRNLVTGSKAATPEMIAHASWDAVVDNYVYIHNAFRNDLQRMIASCENESFVPSELERWRDILNLHSRVEDEIIIVALQARLKETKSSSKLPQEIITGNDHDSVKKLTEKALKSSDNGKRLSLLRELASELDKHLNQEEETVMPLLLETFSHRELWALDSFIVNEKLDYCDKETLIDITKWWFGNISTSEMYPLLKNFIKAGKQPPMPVKAWKKFQDDIPALQKFPMEDLMS